MPQVNYNLASTCIRLRRRFSRQYNIILHFGYVAPDPYETVNPFLDDDVFHRVADGPLPVRAI